MRGARPRVSSRSRRALWPAFLVVYGVTACAVGPDYQRPAVPVPAAWRTPAEGVGSLADLGWWELFQDPALQQLIRTALEKNKDLRMAVARVAEARAQLGVVRADQFPQLDAQGSYTNQRFSERSFQVSALRSFPGIPRLDPQQDFFRTGLDLSFELDLWGRLRRATEAARAELLASEENQRVVVTTLVGDVAQAYFDLLELDREAEIARRTLESRQASLDLMQRRFTEGLATDLDVQRAEGELAVAAATVPDVDRRVAQAENGINVLLGRNPGTVSRGAPLDGQKPLPSVPAGLPSALLARRPDVREAEQQLVAANARIGVAKAAFFPQISLTGMFGVESGALSDLFTGPARVWQVGPTVTLPIFHGGRLRSNLRAAEAREQQAVVRYQQVIQQAFREVDDALVFHQKVQDIRGGRERRVAAARRTLVLATLRYENGLSGYLDLLDAQRQLFSAEVDLASTTRDQLTAVVQVYKTLGGGWEMQASTTPDRMDVR
jgi:outer membrane protein, multidrug efflux system